MISLVLYRPFHGLQNDILDSYERFIFYVGFYFGKMWKIIKKNGRFSGRIWPDWGNTTRADMAGLGSIGLKSYGPSVDSFLSDITRGRPYDFQYLFFVL